MARAPGLGCPPVTRTQRSGGRKPSPRRALDVGAPFGLGLVTPLTPLWPHGVVSLERAAATLTALGRTSGQGRPGSTEPTRGLGWLNSGQCVRIQRVLPARLRTLRSSLGTGVRKPTVCPGKAVLPWREVHALKPTPCP